MKFSGKAKTLQSLEGVLEKGSLLAIEIISIDSWRKDPRLVLSHCAKFLHAHECVVVRSSFSFEDGTQFSHAGECESVANIRTTEDLEEAIERVIASYPSSDGPEILFIQKQLLGVRKSGVLFTVDPNTGAPYYTLNFGELDTTDAVTSGRTNELRTFIISRLYSPAEIAFPDPDIRSLIEMAKELETLFGSTSLDIEFGISKAGEVFLFQVRPLPLRAIPTVSEATLRYHLQLIETKLTTLSKPHPFLCGSNTLFGVMPDWNPAEIIGLRPRPLTLSLYKEMITDSVWAYQRNNYGYRNLRSHPLLHAFGGMPYIDVRVDFNSFVPADIDEPLANKLVQHYLNELERRPELHDKVEFEILFSCYTFDLQEKMQRLRKNGFTDSEIETLSDSLKRLTNSIVDPVSGLWKADTEKIEKLSTRLDTLWSSDLSDTEKIYWILEDCKRYGTLPFAGLARAAFIGVQMLKSMVSEGLLETQDYEDFIGSLETVTSKMDEEFDRLPQNDFLRKYGHLRPGTYDILKPSYDEAAEKYFDWSQKKARPAKRESFRLSLHKLDRIEKALQAAGLNYSVLELFQFIQNVIEGREYSKFVFSKSVSSALKLIAKVGERNGLDREALSFGGIQVFQRDYACETSLITELKRSIESGKESFEITQNLLLPPLIQSPSDVRCYEFPKFEPNYITRKSASGPVTGVDDKAEKLDGSILFIPSADPGFDWIFQRKIAGFVTMYGGVNSHMAIRAGELQIPAIIGAGEINYEQWKRSAEVRIDCENRRVEKIVE